MVCHSQNKKGEVIDTWLKKAMVERELKRQKLVDKYAAKRAELKAKGDYIGLSKLPKKLSSSSSTQSL